MFYAKSKCYVFKLRSCENCNNGISGECYHHTHRDQAMTWLDNAKCGCTAYHGEFETEKRRYTVKYVPKKRYGPRNKPTKKEKNEINHRIY